MADLKVGDLVFNAEGEPTPIIAAVDIYIATAFAVHFDTGEVIYADAPHQWVTMDAAERVASKCRTEAFRAKRRATRPSRAVALSQKPWVSETVTRLNRERRHDYLEPSRGTIRTTAEIRETLRVGAAGAHNHSIDVTEPLKLPAAVLPIDPYTLGLWLGDGDSRQPTIGMSQADMAEILPFIPYEVISYRTDQRPPRQSIYAMVRLDGVLPHLRTLNLWCDKHIPMVYLRASVEQRCELLRGLLDTDGTVTKRGQIELALSDRRLIEDALELVSSLGIKATIHSRPTAGRDSHRIKFMAPFPAFKLPRKLARQKIEGFRDTVARRYITAVEPVAPRPMRCIQVACPSGTYLVGRSMIPTHNSHLMRIAAIHWCAAIPGLQIYFFRRVEGDLLKNHMEGPTSFTALLAPWIIERLIRVTSDRIIFWNGSSIFLCHCAEEQHRFKYLGYEFHVLCVDELTSFTETIYRFLRSRVRIAGIEIPEPFKGLFPRILTGSNPGQVGHLWVKNSFIDNHRPMEIWQTGDDEGGFRRQFIPSRLEDNPSLDDNYRKTLRGLGSPELVKAMELGDWNVVAGAYFADWNTEKLVVEPFKVPRHWMRFTAFDWGYTAPFCHLWFAVSDGYQAADRWIPPGCLVVYREWYGSKGPNVGLELKNWEIAAGIKEREGSEQITYRVADPACWDSSRGPSIAEQFATAKTARGRQVGLLFRKADNSRITGWQELRGRMKGADHPMIQFFSTCTHSIRTIPVLQIDPHRPEDLDTAGEDHACFVGETLVATPQGPCALKSLVGKSGVVRSHDGQWHEFRSARLIGSSQPVITLAFNDGSKVTCTPDHKFLTPTGWREARFLAWCQILSSSRPQFRSSRDAVTASAASIFATRVAFSIAISGSRIAGRWRAISTSITRRRGTGTPSPTWNSGREPSISGSMDWRVANGERDTSPRLESPPPSGTGPRPGANGTGFITKIRRMLSAVANVWRAAIAEPLSTASAIAGSAPMPADELGGGFPASMMRPAPASFATPPSWPTSIARSAPVRANVVASPARAHGLVCLSLSAAGRADVYCLTVPETGNFELANGAIVANCDAARYGVMSRPWVSSKPKAEKARGLAGITLNDAWKTATSYDEGDRL